MFLGILGAFTLGNSSDFFVILRAQNLNVSLLMVVLMLVMFNMTSAAISLPAGILSDKLGRRKVIAIGWSVYALVYLGFALATGLWSIWLLFAYYGIYYGMVKGVARAYVAIFSEREVRDCLWAVLWCCWTYSTARQSVGRMDVG